MSTKALVEAVETLSPSELEILHAAVESRLWSSDDLQLTEHEIRDAQHTLADADNDVALTMGGPDAWALLNTGRR